VDRLIGTASSTQDQVDILRRVGIDAQPAPADAHVLVATAPQPLDVDPGGTETLVATIPSWRRDLLIEADIAEEVARVRGYDTVPTILPDTPMPPYRHSPLGVRHHVRDTLAGIGLSEAVTFALVSPQDG
jgi:phenylalanyl-tRNA synthetase beta subunit